MLRGVFWIGLRAPFEIGHDDFSGIYENPISHEDRGLNPKRDGDGVAGASVDLYDPALCFQIHDCVVGALAELGDDYAGDLSVEACDDALCQVVGVRARVNAGATATRQPS